VGDYIKHGGKLAAGDIRLSLMIDVAAGLEHLHAFEVLHGDLCGKNIMVNDKGRAILIDFGCSKSLANEKSATTSDGWGHWQFKAPELVLRSLEPYKKTVKTDIYAFGSVMLQIASGEWPLKHVSNEDKHRERSKEDDPELAGLFMSRPEDYRQVPENSPLWSLMKNSWKIEPTDRPKLESILQDLRRYQSERIRTERGARSSQMTFDSASI